MPKTLAKIDPTPLPPESNDRELIPPSDPCATAISINPARVSGTACFAGTRVPIQILWDYLEQGPSIEEFLEGYPGVTHEQAKAVLELAFQKLLESLPESTPWR